MATPFSCSSPTVPATLSINGGFIVKYLPVSVLVIALVLAAPATAQVGLNGVYGGLGTNTFGPVNTNILTGGNAELGIQYYPGPGPANGRIYISRRGTGTLTTAPHTLLELDPTGALLSVTTQGPGAAGGIWGHRDGATDGYAGGTKLFWGDDFGIHCYELSSGAPVYVTGPQLVMATNGPQPCTFPLAVQALTGGITRALEYDPNGNGGNGSFWACNFGGSLVQTSLTGAVLSSFAVTTNPAPQWSAYGLAMNLQTGMLWINSAPAGSATLLALIAEVNPATGVFTGRKITPTGTLGTGTWIYAAQGGLCYIQGRAGPTHAPALFPPYSELGVLTQGTPDYFEFLRLDLELGFTSGQETQLQTSKNGAPFSGAATNTFALGDTIAFQYASTSPASPAVLIANVGAAVPAGNTANVAELYILSNVSIPSAGGAGVVPITLGDGFGLGGLLGPDLLVMSPLTSPAAPTPAFAIPNLGGPGAVLSLQAAYLSSNFTPTATNWIRFTQQ
jgi:hypothetical protein